MTIGKPIAVRVYPKSHGSLPSVAINSVSILICEVIKSRRRAASLSAGLLERETEKETRRSWLQIAHEYDTHTTTLSSRHRQRRRNTAVHRCRLTHARALALHARTRARTPAHTLICLGFRLIYIYIPSSTSSSIQNRQHKNLYGSMLVQSGMSASRCSTIQYIVSLWRVLIPPSFFNSPFIFFSGIPCYVPYFSFSYFLFAPSHHITRARSRVRHHCTLYVVHVRVRVIPNRNV